MVSFGVGFWAPLAVRANQATALLLMTGLWVGLHLFMHWRAHRARGVFGDEEVTLFIWPGAAGLVGGLCLSSVYLMMLD